MTHFGTKNCLLLGGKLWIVWFVFAWKKLTFVFVTVWLFTWKNRFVLFYWAVIFSTKIFLLIFNGLLTLLGMVLVPLLWKRLRFLEMRMGFEEDVTKVRFLLRSFSCFPLSSWALVCFLFWRPDLDPNPFPNGFMYSSLAVLSGDDDLFKLERNFIICGLFLRR